MSKFALILNEKPRTCSYCPCYRRADVGAFISYCGKTHKELKYEFMRGYIVPEWCPLKEVPEPMDVWYEDESSDFERGYNSCLYEIVGKENEEE